MPAPLSLLAEKRRARFLGNPVPAGRSRARGKRPPRHNGVAMISSAARGARHGRRAPDETTHQTREGSARCCMRWWLSFITSDSHSTIHPVRRSRPSLTSAHTNERSSSLPPYYCQWRYGECVGSWLGLSRLWWVQDPETHSSQSRPAGPIRGTVDVLRKSSTPSRASGSIA